MVTNANQAVVELRAMIRVLLDQVDYTRGACSPSEMVGACLPTDIIGMARRIVNDTAEFE